jgi:selenide,water dikinase
VCSSDLNTGQNLEILEKILQGGLAKMQEAACAVIGGHSIGDDEIKFGYAVTGLINPQRILANATARAGDRLILTKRLGTGIIGTALKKERASNVSVEAAIESMCSLNRAASETALRYAVRAATDITGFGLLGHAREMAAGSKVSLVIDSGRVEFLSEAIDYSRAGFLPGGLKRNIEFIGGCVEFADRVPEEIRNLLYDPQTSGGLLLSVDAADSSALLQTLHERSIIAQEAGEVIARTSPLIEVR